MEYWAREGMSLLFKGVASLFLIAYLPEVGHIATLCFKRDLEACYFFWTIWLARDSVTV